jgi:flagellar biosynthesis/type III secretory pathway chaperone
MDALTKSLQEAIDCYQKLLDEYTQARQFLSSGSVDEVRQITKQLATLHARVQGLDSRCLEMSQEKGIVLGDLPLFPEWSRKIEEVNKENKALIRRLQGGMAVIQDELARLRQGKKLISGYHSGKDSTGRQINIYSR